MRVFSGIGRFDGNAAQFRAWTFRIARNLVIDERRAFGRRPTTLAAEFRDAMQDWADCKDTAGEDDEAAGEDDEAVSDDEAGGDDETAGDEACDDKPHPRDFGITTPPSDRAGGRHGPDDTPAPEADTDDEVDGPSAQGRNAPAPEADTEDQASDPSERGRSTPPQASPNASSRGASDKAPGRP